MAIRLSKNPLNIHPIYSPRTTYKRIKQQDERMIADMTLNFDKLTINMLKQEFDRKNNMLTLKEFITISSKHLRFWQVELPNRQARLVRYLTYLFNEIDINGNGDMQWEEFTNYIIQKATVLKNLKTKNDEIKHYIKSEVVPKAKIDGMVHKLEYLSDFDKIAYYEEGSHVINFINSDNGELCPKSLHITPKQLVVNISSVKKQKTGKATIRKKDLVLPTRVRVLDMLYLPDKKYKLLLVATSDGYVRGWKYTQNGIIMANQPDNEEEPFEHHFSAQIYSLAWDSINEVLYCGQKNGGIYMWNLKTDLQKTLTEGKDDDGGEEKANLLITSMITMPKLQFMASGRMDGKLILWDTINSKKKWIYKQHVRGILSLAFNQTMILLFSAGFDHKICIWNPYIPTLIHKIEGHLSPIFSLKVIENSHQLVSMDSEGIVKITDTRRFNIISSFSVETESNHGQMSGGGFVSGFISINKPQKQMLRLAFGGKSIWFYDYDKNYNPAAADENTVISCRYVKETLSFFTPTGNKIKVWSALNGDVEKIYMDITPNEISAFDFDYLRKRMIIGDTKGNIALYNTVNGARMKNLTKHGGEITHLIATQHPETKADIFISYGLDNQVRISRQTQESFEVIRTIYIKKEIEVTCLEFCPDNRIIMMSTNASNLAFFDIETGKNVGNYYSDNKTEQFTTITRVSREVIVSTSLSGRITLIGVPPFPYRFQQMLTFRHKDPEKQGAYLGIRHSCYNNISKLLYIVDDKMFLTCYDITVFRDLEKSDLSRQKIQFQRKNIIKYILEKAEITLKWQVKAHTETVKVLEFIEEMNIIMTSSFDRKVKIWKAETGEYLDSLQQNYNKPAPEPLAHYDAKKKYLYTKDRKKAFEGVEISPTDLDFNPYVMEEVKEGKEEEFSESRSNKEWNLDAEFKSIVEDQMHAFNNILNLVGNDCGQTPKQLLKSQENLRTYPLQLIDKKNRLLKQIRDQKGNSTSGQTSQGFESVKFEKESRKYSNNYFRRSMIKCIQNFVDKNESMQLMDHLKNDKDKVFGKKKHFDYVPIYKMVHQTQQTFEEMKEHKKYLMELANKDTENILNSRKKHQIMLSREQTTAANRLFHMLRTTETRRNHVPVSYLPKDIKGPSKKESKEPEPDLDGQRAQSRGKAGLSAFHALHKRNKLESLERKSCEVKEQ